MRHTVSFIFWQLTLNNGRVPQPLGVDSPLPVLFALLSIMPPVFFKTSWDTDIIEKKYDEQDWYDEGLVDENAEEEIQKAQLAYLDERVGWVTEMTDDFRSWVQGGWEYAPLPEEADSVCDLADVLRILAHVLTVWRASWKQPPCEQEREDAEWLNNALIRRMSLQDFDPGRDSFELLVNLLLYKRKTMVASGVYLAGQLLRVRQESDRCHEC